MRGVREFHGKFFSSREFGGCSRELFIRYVVQYNELPVISIDLIVHSDWIPPHMVDMDVTTFLLKVKIE
jgi:hypothetical protein